MPFKPGDVVTVFNNRIDSGLPIIEGKAVVIEESYDEGYYFVRFEDGCEVERFISEGEAQSNPQKWLLKLLRDWEVRQRVGFLD